MTRLDLALFDLFWLFAAVLRLFGPSWMFFLALWIFVGFLVLCFSFFGRF